MNPVLNFLAFYNSKGPPNQRGLQVWDGRITKSTLPVLMALESSTNNDCLSPPKYSLMHFSAKVTRTRFELLVAAVVVIERKEGLMELRGKWE